MHNTQNIDCRLQSVAGNQINLNFHRLFPFLLIVGGKDNINFAIKYLIQELNLATNLSLSMATQIAFSYITSKNTGFFVFRLSLIPRKRLLGKTGNFNFNTS
jgi:hypothetical protein